MAKVASTLTLLSLLFAFTNARTPFDIPENDVTFLDLSTPLRENDIVKPKLLLPSEKPIYEPNTPKIADNQTPVEIKNDDVGVVAEEEDQKPVEGKNRLVAEEEDQKPVDGKNDGVAAVKGKGFDREMFHSVSAVHPRWMKHHHHGEHEGRPWFPFFGRHHHHDHDDHHHHHHHHDHHDDDHDHNHHHDNDDHDDDHDDNDDHDHDDDHDHHHDHHHDDDDHDDDHDHGKHQSSIRRPFIRRDQVEEEKEEREGDGGFLDGILDFFDDLF